MWLFVEQTKEYIPFDENHTEKVFLDGEKGWAVKQKDGKVYHFSKEQYEKKLLRELDSEAYWKIRNIEDAAKGLTQEEVKLVKKMLKQKHKEEEDD